MIPPPNTAIRNVRPRRPSVMKMAADTADITATRAAAHLPKFEPALFSLFVLFAIWTHLMGWRGEAGGGEMSG